MVPVLQACGHNVTRTGQRPVRAMRPADTALPAFPRGGGTFATCGATSWRDSTRSSIWPRCPTIRSAISTRDLTMGHQPSGVGPAGRARARCRRPAVSLCVVVQHVRRGRRATICSTEEAPLCPITPYAESKVRAEEDIAKLADCGVQPRVPAKRHRLRSVSAPSRRHRAEQSRRLGIHDRQDSHHERRYAVAAHRACGGHRPRVCRVPRRAARGDSQPGVQHRPRA